MYLNKNIDERLKKFPIQDVWGVGRQLSKLYIKNGIENAYQLKSVSNTWVKKVQMFLDQEQQWNYEA